MAVLSRDALEGSPLADLHVLGRELGIDAIKLTREHLLFFGASVRAGHGHTPTLQD